MERARKRQQLPDRGPSLRPRSREGSGDRTTPEGGHRGHIGTLGQKRGPAWGPRQGRGRAPLGRCLPGPSLVSPVHGPGPWLPWRQLPAGPAPPGTPAPPAPGQGVLLGSWSLTPVPRAHGRLLWGSATPRLPGPQLATRGPVPGKMGPWLLEEGGEPTRAGQSAPDRDPGPSRGQSGCRVRRLERPARAAAAARLTRLPELRPPSFRNRLFSCFSLSPSLHSGKFILL